MRRKRKFKIIRDERARTLLGAHRHCEDACERAFRRIGKINQRLGGDPDHFAPFPPKPKGLWQRTYKRQWRRYLEAEDRAENAFKL